MTEPVLLGLRSDSSGRYAVKAPVIPLGRTDPVVGGGAGVVARGEAGAGAIGAVEKSLLHSLPWFGA